MKTGTEVVEFKAHNHYIISLCVVNTQEGWRIISGSINGTIRIWDMKTGQKVGECRTKVGSLCVQRKKTVGVLYQVLGMEIYVYGI